VTRRLRIAIFAPAIAGLAALLLWAAVGLPRFGHYRGPYGFVLNRIVVPERHTSNVVNAVVFDVRGVDTMGEELILFAAVVGVAVLLRARPSPGESAPDAGGDAVRVLGALFVGAGVLVGLWLIAFGFVTPGGGFQGGVTVAAGALLLYVAAGFRGWRPFGNEGVLDPVEALGAGGYVVIGLAALIAGMPFLANMLGGGVTGTLRSGGTASFVNWAAGIEVAGANLVLFSEFLRKYVVPLGEGRDGR
jgi:multicomponent Na+:H+ antiporter subunit B